jgi:hypothetical protein
MFLLQTHNVRNYGLSGATADRGWNGEDRMSFPWFLEGANAMVDRKETRPRDDADRARDAGAKAAEDARQAVGRAGEAASRAADEGRATVEAATEDMQEISRAAVSQLTRRMDETAEGLVEAQRQGMDAAVQDLTAAGQVATNSAGLAAEFSCALMDWSREVIEVNARAPQRMFSSDSLKQAYDAQLQLIQTLFRQWSEANSWLFSATVRPARRDG